MKNVSVLPRWVPTSFAQQESAEKVQIPNMYAGWAKSISQAIFARFVKTPLRHSVNIPANLCYNHWSKIQF